jgi:hypothetical protein
MWKWDERSGKVVDRGLYGGLVGHCLVAEVLACDALGLGF